MFLCIQSYVAAAIEYLRKLGQAMAQMRTFCLSRLQEMMTSCSGKVYQTVITTKYNYNYLVTTRISIGICVADRCTRETSVILQYLWIKVGGNLHVHIHM